MKRKDFSIGIFVVLVTLVIAFPAHALTLTFSDFNKFHPPTAENTDVIAVITDFGLNTVQITMDATQLLGSLKITEWYFNVASSFFPGLDASNFSQTNAAPPSGSVNASENNFKADGDGFFDILFTFPENGPNVFLTGGSSTWTVTYPGLNAQAFDFLSAPAGGAGPFYSAVKLGEAYWGTDTAPSTAPSAVPEPATMLLLGSGLIGTGTFARRKFKK